jgi:AhpD family alkylhydroperoxidase
MVWDGPLSRPQAELLAARVSSINECFYCTSAHVMLLRESSKAVDLIIDTNASMGGQGAETVDHGAELVSFAEAATLCSGNVDQVREAVLERLGAEGFVDAASIIGIFNGLVRTADATGIPLDDSMKLATVEARKDLGINDFRGALNTL